MSQKIKYLKNYLVNFDETNFVKIQNGSKQ